MRRALSQHRERILLVGLRDWRSFEFPQYPDDGPKPGSIYLQRYAEKHRAAGNGFGFDLTTERGIARTLSARYQKDGSEILITQKSRNPRKLTPLERKCALHVPATQPGYEAGRETVPCHARAGAAE